MSGPAGFFAGVDKLEGLGVKPPEVDDMFGTSA